jgi:hypothetical protein
MSNFFVGPLPFVPSNPTTFDFRFNYFENCDDVCCLSGTECESTCPPTHANDALPLGILKSEWTELNISILGTPKRIIQIATSFASRPFILKSYSCPNATSLNPCNQTADDNSADILASMTQIFKNLAITSTQSPNTYRNFYYTIDGDICSTSILVM